MLELNAAEAELKQIARAGISGVPAVLGDGREWVLADYLVGRGEVWDRLYDGNLLRGEYEPGDLRLAAFELLRANYVLDVDDAIALIRMANPAEFIDPIERVLFGTFRPERSYQDWVDVMLTINGLDRRKIDRKLIRPVLDHLVARGKAVPANKWVTSAVRAGKKNAMKDLARRGKPER